MDYEPIDISALCSAGPDTLPGENPKLGEQTMRGLPFTVGAPGGNADGNCYVSLGEGDAPITVPVAKLAHNVIFAHRQMETEQHANGPIGVHVADYVIWFQDSETVTVPIRERYEISVVSDRQGISRFGIGYPYIAVTDREDTLMPRYEGRFDLIGRRQTEAVQALPAWYWLFGWRNPTPDRVIESIELVPRGPRFIVAGVTLGHVDEHPFSRNARRPVRVTLKDADRAEEPFDLDVTIDGASAPTSTHSPSSRPTSSSPTRRGASVRPRTRCRALPMSNYPASLPPPLRCRRAARQSTE